VNKADSNFLKYAVGYLRRAFSANFLVLNGFDKIKSSNLCIRTAAIAQMISLEEFYPASRQPAKMNSGGLFATRNFKRFPSVVSSDGLIFASTVCRRQLHRDVLADFEVAHANLPGRLRGFYHALPDSTFLSVKSQECRHRIQRNG